MRRLKSYLYRRGIRDNESYAKWAADNEISSLADINDFCSSRGIEVKDEPAIRAMFEFLFRNDPVKPAVEPKVKAQSKSKSKAWHVPAAERPLSKSTSAPQPKRKRRPRKAAAPKDEK